MAKHTHNCEECGRTWECWGLVCREDREKVCSYCESDDDDEDEEEE